MLPPSIRVTTEYKSKHLIDIRATLEFSLSPRDHTSHQILGNMCTYCLVLYLFFCIVLCIVNDVDASILSYCVSFSTVLYATIYMLYTFYLIFRVKPCHTGWKTKGYIAIETRVQDTCPPEGNTKVMVSQYKGIHARKFVGLITPKDSSVGLYNDVH